jgi:hypothetical protein
VYGNDMTAADRAHLESRIGADAPPADAPEASQ